jgi:hypothetical protein
MRRNQSINNKQIPTPVAGNHRGDGRDKLHVQVFKTTEPTTIRVMMHPQDESNRGKGRAIHARVMVNACVQDVQKGISKKGQSCPSTLALKGRIFLTWLWNCLKTSIAPSDKFYL